jgi:4'-phosphopantetheinyl transferase
VPSLLPGADDAHVWIAREAEFAGWGEALDALLTPREHAELQAHPGGRPNRRLSRALVRLLLTHYLRHQAAEVEVVRDCPDCGRAHGRPRLTAGPARSAAPGVQLAVSHSHGLTVIAVAAQNLGIDVEHLGWNSETSPELVEFALTPDERRFLQAAPRSLHHGRFLRYWTGKEAVLKALGVGLAVDPQAVSLPLLPPGGKAWVELPDGGRTSFYVQPVGIAGHLCTLASERPVRAVRVAPLSASLLAVKKPA